VNEREQKQNVKSVMIAKGVTVGGLLTSESLSPPLTQVASVTNVTLSKGQVINQTSSNATLATTSSVSLILQYFALMSYFMGQSTPF